MSRASSYLRRAHCWHVDACVVVSIEGEIGRLEFAEGISSVSTSSLKYGENIHEKFQTRYKIPKATYAGRDKRTNFGE